MPLTAGKAARARKEPASTPERLSSGGTPLGQILVRKGFINEDQLTEALSRQEETGRRVGVLLVELGAVREADVVSGLSEQLGMQVIELHLEEPDSEIVALLPEDLSRELKAIPIRRENSGKVVVAVTEPLDGAALNKLKSALKAEPQLFLASDHDIRRVIDSSYRALDGVGRLVEAFEVTEATRRTPSLTSITAGQDAPVVKVVNLLLTQALRDRASDIHIEPQEERVRIRYRIDGALHDVVSLPANMGPALVSRLKIMAVMNIVEKRRPQDGTIATQVDGRLIDVRVNTVPTIWGEKAVLRLLDRNRSMMRLYDLGMPPQVHEIYSRLVRVPFGMVICAGPTGSGKTTTLYATLEEINKTEANITTLEDPVEYVFPSINQIQINEQASITFADGLRSILRQDPDIILLGEIRDVETARLAVQSALTGHLVLSSLHSTDAAASVHRFVDMGIEPFLVASSLSGIISQRLVRRICSHCRVQFQPPVEELAFYRERGGPDKNQFWHGQGCNFCARTGYQGRIGVYELLLVTDDIKRLVVDKAPREAIQEAAVAQGMRPLLDSGIALVADDVTTVSEIMRAIYAL